MEDKRSAKELYIQFKGPGLLILVEFEDFANHRTGICSQVAAIIKGWA